MNTPMKKLAVAVSAALVTLTTCAPAAHADQPSQFAVITATQDPELLAQAETHVVTVDKDGKVTETTTSGPRVIVSQSGKSGDGKTRIVEHVNSYSYSNSKAGDVDVVVSTALSNAFAHGGLAGRAMKNAPYAADVINERTQTLQDGNQIVKRTQGFVARDSAGRTRQETRDENGVLKTVNIADPLDGSRLVLVPQGKTATRINFDKDITRRVEEMREKAKQMAQQASDMKASLSEKKPGEEISVVRIGGDGQNVREEVKVNVIRSSGGEGKSGSGKVISLSGHDFPGAIDARGAQSLSSLAPLNVALGDMKWSRGATLRDLGTKDIEGVRAEGKMRSYTIPAGEIGNKSAITVSTETWTSPDLGITLYSRHSDPRSGDTVYRVTNLKRNEQPISLFSAPEGYNVKEVASFGTTSQSAR